MYHASPHLTYLLQTDLLKPDVSKLNYPLYPPWDWAETSEGFSARTYGALLPESWTVVRADKYVKVHSIGNI